MEHGFESLATFLHTYAAPLFWLAGFSLLLTLASLLLVPWLILRLPADYFAGEKRRRAAWALRHPLIRALVLTGRTVVGLLLILTGLVLLALPGQGLLTILMGLMIAVYPGKYRLERWLVTRPALLKSINWLRRRAHRPPLDLD
ncbi:MAG: PGPGW domain-containing protein [Candidatus Delongbacteria bacterium]